VFCSVCHVENYLFCLESCHHCCCHNLSVIFFCAPTSWFPWWCQWSLLNRFCPGHFHCSFLSLVQRSFDSFFSVFDIALSSVFCLFNLNWIFRSSDKKEKNILVSDIKIACDSLTVSLLVTVICRSRWKIMPKNMKLEFQIPTWLAVLLHLCLKRFAFWYCW